MKSRVGHNAAATEGACKCFAIHWCSLVLLSPGGVAKDRMDKLSENGGRRSLILQHVYGTRFGTDGREGADELVLLDNLVKAEIIVPFSAYAFNALGQALSSSVNQGTEYGAAFQLGFWFNGSVPGASGGAHAISFYCTRMGQDKVVHIFDPNFGEFVIRIGELDTFMMALFRRYGPVQHQQLRRLRLVSIFKPLVGR